MWQGRCLLFRNLCEYAARHHQQSTGINTPHYAPAPVVVQLLPHTLVQHRDGSGAQVTPGPTTHPLLLSYSSCHTP